LTNREIIRPPTGVEIDPTKRSDDGSGHGKSQQVPIALVVAVAENGIIGNKGALPWRIPEDLQRFKSLTLGKPCIMGRRTWESLPRRPLPGRTNIVVTRNGAFRAEGAQVAGDFEHALQIAAEDHPLEIAVIGGEKIFEAALPRAHRIYLTEVTGSPEGDVLMPKIDRAEWRELYRDGPHEKPGFRYSFVTLERRSH
jgi:dihydrofolate reductase